MRKPESVSTLAKLGRVRLSPSFFMRDMLYSEIANIEGLQNVPDFPEIAIESGTKLCTELLEPLQSKFGRVSIRSAYRSPEVNEFGNKHNHQCSRNEITYADHIWDYRDKDGNLGATATIVVNNFIPYYEKTGDWESLAWYIHDHLPYSSMEFYPIYAAFNFRWRENPERRITSRCPPRLGYLTKPGMENHEGDHSHLYANMLSEICGD